LGIVVLQVDLKFDGLQELPLLGLGELQNLIHALQNRVAGDLRHFSRFSLLEI